MPDLKQNEFALAVAKALGLLREKHVAEEGKKAKTKSNGAGLARTPTPTQNAAQLQAELLEAVDLGDLARAKSLVVSGASVAGPFEKGRGLFYAWFEAARKSSSHQREEEIKNAYDMLVWLDEQRLPWEPVGHGKAGRDYVERKRALAQSRMEHDQLREDNIQWFCNHRAFERLGDSALGPAFARLAGSWEKESCEGVGVRGRLWLTFLFDIGPRVEKALVFAAELGKHGVRMSASHWEDVTHAVGNNMLAVSPETLTLLAREQKPIKGVGPGLMSILIHHALAYDSLEELAELANLCQKPMWRLGPEAWKKTFVKESFYGPSLIECAAACSAGSSPIFKSSGGFDCLTALAMSPEALAEHGKRGLHSRLLIHADATMLVRLIEAAPVLLDPDKKGDTFLHHFARMLPNVALEKRLTKLTDSRLVQAMLEPNAERETPIGIALSSKHVPASTRLELEKALVRYEARQITKEVKRGTSRGTARKTRL